MKKGKIEKGENIAHTYYWRKLENE